MKTILSGVILLAVGTFCFPPLVAMLLGPVLVLGPMFLLANLIPDSKNKLKKPVRKPES